MIPMWIVYGIIIGLFGYVIDPDRSIESLVRGMLLGTVGALQGLLVSVILSSLPVSVAQPPPLFLSFFFAFFLLAVGKLTRKAF